MTATVQVGSDRATSLIDGKARSRPGPEAPRRDNEWCFVLNRCDVPEPALAGDRCRPVEHG
jgi:hypothetical protein